MQAVMETVDQWLRQMSSDWETPVGLDQEGACSISAGNGFSLELYVVPSSGMCHMGIYLLDVPPAAREGFFAMLLHMNIHQQETQGATLAVDPIREGVLLCYMQAVATLTAEYFYNLVQNLIATAATLKTHIEDGQAKLQEAVYRDGTAAYDETYDEGDEADDEEADETFANAASSVAAPAYQPVTSHFNHFMSLV